MVEVRGLKGIHYNKQQIGDIEGVITQPYDKITGDMQEEYYRKSEYNYCRVILPREENRYIAASQRLKEWIEEGILGKEENPGIYIYYQDFEVLGSKFTRKGFISAVKLHPFEERVVLPHEETHRGPKIDRLNMLQATKTDLEPLFMLYSDPANITIDIFDEVIEEDPMFEATDIYGVHSRIWKIEDPQKIREVGKFFQGEQVVIADGHHRYETALTFREQMREENSDWMEDHAFNWKMTYMAPVEEKGLRILPGHRLLLKHELTGEHIDEMGEYFEIKEVALDDAANFLKENEDTASFIVHDGKRTLGLILKDGESIEKFMSKDYSEDYRELDVVILRDVIFEGIMNTGDLAIDVDISYERWSKDAIRKVDTGEGSIAFLVNATKPEQVLKIAKRGERMPEKSTDFYPKVNSGFILMDISAAEKINK
jgi:uncharacterized protein (DUF1015 family)